MTTTIKVSTELRDRVNARAHQDGVTAAGLIANLLDDRERRERMAAFGRAFRSADADYWDEFRAWDEISIDDRD